MLLKRVIDGFWHQMVDETFTFSQRKREHKAHLYLYGYIHTFLVSTAVMVVMEMTLSGVTCYLRD